MAQAAPFVISEFTNPSGKVVFRVTGWLDGKRIRKNFRTHAEAVAERQTLEIHCLQSETGIHTAVTRLTDNQLHEAEAAFRRLEGAPKSLTFYLDYALANYRTPEREISVEAAVATRNRSGWLVTMRAEDWLTLIRESKSRAPSRLSNLKSPI